jgi:hypothetical protein
MVELAIEGAYITRVSGRYHHLSFYSKKFSC